MKGIELNAKVCIPHSEKGKCFYHFFFYKNPFNKAFLRDICETRHTKMLSFSFLCLYVYDLSQGCVNCCIQMSTIYRHALALDLPAGEELATGRCTDRLHVVILQLHSIRRQLIQRGCAHVRVVVADIIETQVVCHDEDDVRWSAGVRYRRIILHLVLARPVPGEETRTEHHGETRQSRSRHGTAAVRAFSLGVHKPERSFTRSSQPW